MVEKVQVGILYPTFSLRLMRLISRSSARNQIKALRCIYIDDLLSNLFKEPIEEKIPPLTYSKLCAEGVKLIEDQKKDQSISDDLLELQATDGALIIFY